MSRDEARTISGVPVRHDALYLPHSGMVSPVLVVPALAEAARQIYTERVNELQRSSNGWVVNGRSYSHVVLASAHDVTRFPEAAFLPLQEVRGQVSIVDTPLGLSALQTNLCYGGYASHPFVGKMVVGSTFQHWLDTPDLRQACEVCVNALLPPPRVMLAVIMRMPSPPNSPLATEKLTVESAAFAPW